MTSRWLFLSTALVSFAPTGRAATAAPGRATLDWMTQAWPEVPTWSEWQRRTGALPPDFAALPSANFLPDPFTFHDGRRVAMPADWEARRAEIKALLQKYVLGTLPPKPALGRVTPVGPPAVFPGYSTRSVTLHYGPEDRISSAVSVTLPAGPGPFYDRHPQWSQLGRLIDDTRAAIDALEKEADIDATPADVRAAVERARAAYTATGAAGQLGLDEPVDYQRLLAATQSRAIAWLQAHP